MPGIGSEFYLFRYIYSNYKLVAITFTPCYHYFMSKFAKLLQRFLSKPKDFTFEELKSLLKSVGYEEANTGKTSGSRVAFINHQTKNIIRMHRPHPHPELKRYQLDDIEETLRKAEVIK
jgi:hypothetical protein